MCQQGIAGNGCQNHESDTDCFHCREFLLVGLAGCGLDYKWLAGQCFVSEVTVYNWMAKKKIPEVKEHIIRSLMTEMPVTLPSIKVETESRVILQLPPDVQVALERKALDSKMTLTDFLATKINEIVHDDSSSEPSLVAEIEREEFSKEDN